MLYNFADPEATMPGKTPYPAEALSINGEFLENIIPGYRTLYTSGRELLGATLNTDENDYLDGARLKSRKFDQRTITVGFQIIASDEKMYRDAFTKLNGVLVADDAQLIFHDEPDKMFYGTLTGVSDIDPGKNAVTGEYEITCIDPFKYSTEEKTATASSNGDIYINYAGTAKAYPACIATLSQNARSEYIAFMDGEGNIISIGNLEGKISTTGTSSTSKDLVNETFTGSLSYVLVCGDDVICADDLAVSTENSWDVNAGTFYGDETMAQTQTLQSKDGMLTLPDAGTGANFHGGAISTNILQGVSGRYSTDTMAKFAIGFDGSMTECGIIKISVNSYRTSKQEVMSFTIKKTKVGKYADVVFSVLGIVRKSIEVELPGDGTVVMHKKGTKVTFDFGGKSYTFYDSAISSVEAHEIDIYLGGYSDYAKMSTLYVGTTSVIDAPEAIAAGNVVKANCGTAEITVDDVLANDLGAIGNDWDDFCLKPGPNRIHCTSNLTSGIEYCIKYREVYL